MRLLAALLVSTALAAPAGATAASGLWGVVTRGPTMPVCIVGRPCSAPARGLTLTFWRSGRVVARATTNADGRYRLPLRPGLYAVRIAAPQPVGRGLEPARAQVASGRFTRLDFSLDTGIR